MFRSSAARLRSLLGPQRKLFLLVFLWTCLCLVIFKSSLFGSSSQSSQAQPGDRQKVRARSASSDYPAPLSLELEPEFALPDNGNSNAVYYSLSALSSSSSSSSSSPTISARSHQEASQTAQPKTPAIKSDTKKPKSAHKAAKQRTASHDDTAHFVTGSQCDYDYPSLFDLQFNNIHWQKMTTTSSSSSNASTTTNSQLQTATYYLYNAYYDDRWRAGLPSVRVLAMIDRIQPPPTNCLLWPSKSKQANGQRARPLVTRATFVYAWYPKWGNYKDGILQPWIVTCAIPKGRAGFVPDSVSLVGVPPEIRDDQDDQPEEERSKRDASSENSAAIAASIAMPPSFSSSSPALANAESSSSSSSTQTSEQHQTKPMKSVQYDCKQVLPITNNLPVFNSRPKVKQKFAVCVKGLDFPHDDVSVRLVEWIEMLNLLGAGKIFLYNLDVHENISKVLHYYEKRGIVELSPLTLPGDQPNLPEYQHLYLKNRLTAKRQNELIPYNDCLYRNLYSYQYLALLDIDEIIMPLKQEHNNWLDLMQEVEWASLYEQNYSRASYNVRNVYFFDDLSGPLGTTAASTTLAGHQLTSANDNDLSSVGSSSSPSSSSPLLLERNNDVVSQTNGVDGSRGEAGSTGTTGDDDSDDHDDDDNGGQVENEQEAFNDNNKNSNHRQHPESLERGIPHYLHMMSHVYRSKNYTEPGQYVKCFHNTERVVSLHNHFPMNCFGQCTTYSIPVSMAHLQHYRKDCVGPLKQSCKNNFRVFTTRDTTIWKYKQRMIRRTTRVLNHLGLLSSPSSSTGKSL